MATATTTATTDTEVIAWLYPWDSDPLGQAAATVQLNAARGLLMPALPMDEGSIYGESVPTALPDGDDTDDESYLHTDGIRLGLDTGPHNPEGFVFGRKPTCNIVVPDDPVLKGVSGRQCVLAFDELDRLILQDLRDPNQAGDETEVCYNGVETGKRRGFKWILRMAADPFANTFRDIQIVFHKRLKFRLRIAYHNLHPANITRFHKAASLAIQGLTLASASTTAPESFAETPHARSAFLEQSLIGEGSYGSVWRVWDISTGRVYARKRPTVDGESSRRPVKIERWLSEIAAMKAISHVSDTDRLDPSSLPVCLCHRAI